MLYFEHIYVLLLFLVFPRKVHYAVKVNNFVSYSSFDPLESGQFKMFLTYVIKVDKREVLRLYFEHIYVLLLFLAFPGKLPLGRENE